MLMQPLAGVAGASRKNSGFKPLPALVAVVGAVNRKVAWPFNVTYTGLLVVSTNSIQ